MSLTLALNNAIAGLNVNQRALATISQNIANANTAGYTRKTVDQSSVVLNGNGAGVKIDDITRKVDDYLSRAIRATAGDAARTATLSDYMERLQTYLGNPGQDNSLDSKITTFFNTLQSLAETPETTSTRSQLVAQANQMALDISDLAYSIEDLRYQADQEIGTSITQFNETLKKLNTINTALAQATTFGSPSADLLDKRDMLLKDVASFMDCQILVQPDGRAFVYTRQGQSILDERQYQLEYTPASSVGTFTNNGNLNNISIRQLSTNGNPTSNVAILVQGGTTGNVDSSRVDGGKLKGLLQARDELLPEFTAQLNELAATMRDEFNAIHNQGSGYPGAKSYTGTKAMLASDYTGMQGAVQIALLKADGSPYQSPYTNESGIPPLTIDFGALNGGQGNGQPTLQSIIDEINYYYGSPQNKVSLGNFNNIQMAAISNDIPGVPPQFTFDFDIENISGGVGKFFVTDVAVADDTGTDITNVTTTQPQIALDPANTYTTTTGSNVVTVTSSTPHGLKNGDIVYLGDPGTSVNGFAASDLTGYFVVSNVTGNSFDITTATGTATSPGAAGVSGMTAMPPYDTVQTGEHTRTGSNGALTANLSANPNSQYYEFTVSYGVAQADGTISTGTVTYRVLREQNIMNQRTSGNSATGDATVTVPTTTQGLLKASMVDENGNEIPVVNGKIADVKGYLKIESLVDGGYVSFSDLGSKEVGVAGYKEATGRNFFHYMELNNFFEENHSSVAGDKRNLSNAALNFAVESRILKEPGLVTTGQLARSNQSSDPTKPPVYTYERYQGDNSLVQKLAKLGSQAITFGAAGAIPASKSSLVGYAGEFLGYVSDKTRTAQSAASDSITLQSGLETRADSISGVNLDQELADTIIYQNAYTASARIISVTNDLFGALLNTFN